MKKLILSIIVLFLFFVPTNVLAEDINENSVVKIGGDGEYGEIYGAERNPEQGDNSKWLTIKPGEAGVRVVGEKNNEIISIDKYGGIYLNGDVYLNNNLLKLKDSALLYFIILISILLNILIFIKYNKIKKEIWEMTNVSRK